MLDNYIVVTTLCNSKQVANAIKDTLLSKKLVAGVQISEVLSDYYWHHKLEHAIEYKIEMRTKESLFKAIEKEIKEVHDYEVAEISYYEIKGSKEFLHWIAEEVNSTNSSC